MAGFFSIVSTALKVPAPLPVQVGIDAVAGIAFVGYKLWRKSGRLNFESPPYTSYDAGSGESSNKQSEQTVAKEPRV